MEKKYYQISLYQTENPVISEAQTTEENTENIKVAMAHLAYGHLVMLDGVIFHGITAMQQFIEKARQICECDIKELALEQQRLIEKIVNTHK